MSLRIIQTKLESYHCQTLQDETNALKEITQEVALASLARAGFFKFAAFQGGTCLRILYGMDRFSEDLDFVLQKTDAKFSFDPFVQALTLEFAAYGYHLQLSDRSKPELAVKKLFLKDQSIGKVLSLAFERPRDAPLPIQVKLEVDTRPPAGSHFETKYLDFPFPFAVTIQDFPSLFASKSHALLCREYVKGRDWFDFVWYVSRKATVNFPLLAAALDQAGPWKNQSLPIDKTWYAAEMKKKINSIDWTSAQADIRRFVRSSQQPSIELWSREFFIDRLHKLLNY